MFSFSVSTEDVPAENY